MNKTSTLVEYRSKLIQLRQVPDQEDPLDAERVDMVVRRWKAQDQAYLGFAKTVEEHIRMLSGRQWDVWSDIYGRFVDVLQFMTEDERKHRMRPVMDYLGYWFLLTLSKATENQPQISFLPATSDRLDAMLAEVMDPIWKTLFQEMDMDHVIERAAAWKLVAGEVYFLTRVDFQAGAKRQLIGPAVLQLDRGDGQAPIERVAGAVPFGKDGSPLAQLVPDPDHPDDPEAFGYDVTGEPYEDLEGSPKVDALCPLQVRAQWGQHIPWRDKRWMAHEWFLLPEQVKEQFGADVDPDHVVGTDEQSPGYLERMLFGTGYFGASRGDPTATTTSTEAKLHEGYVRGITMWEKPIPGLTDATDDHDPGGRLLVVAPGANKVLWDSKRPFKTECAGPIRRSVFIDIPGRPNGTTILERLTPLQKRLNRVEAQVAEHTNLCTNPILLVHDACGIDDDEWVARPGVIITHGYNGPGTPAQWLAPPPLSPDVWRHKSDIREQMFVIGSMMGNQSSAPTKNASGDLIQELRFNADRPVQPLMKNLVIAISDVAQDVQAILPTIWDQEKVISYAGADNVVRTVTVLPEMFQGRTRVTPSIEAATAGSKTARRAEVTQMWQMGAFGDPADPAARKQYLELVNYPDLTRAARDGGVDRVMAEHNLGRLVRGEQAAAIPILEVYDLGVHLMVVESFMKAPEYLQQDPPIQTQFVLYRQAIMVAQEVQQMNKIDRAMPLAAKQAAAQGAIAQVAKDAHPNDPPPQPKTAPPPSGSNDPGAGAPNTQAA